VPERKYFFFSFFGTLYFSGVTSEKVQLPCHSDEGRISITRRPFHSSGRPGGQRNPNTILPNGNVGMMALQVVPADERKISLNAEPGNLDEN
jgi:hypothetical protein